MNPSIEFNLSTTATLGKKKVVVVERWLFSTGLNKYQCMACLPKKLEVAVVERWLLVEVRLYLTMQHKKRLTKLLDLCAGAALPV